jgi:predicted alpha-1,2-mannosidase
LSATVLAQAPNPARDLVNPFIGTGGHGHTFPGACVPNGLVQLSPDTRPDGHNDWDGCSGYHYSDSVVYGFSHTHLSGTGVADLCDVLLMPMSGSWSLDPERYRSRFRKETEAAHAGYYRVRLDDHGIDVELTATKRVGVHRYHYPAGRDAHVVLDLEHRDHTEQTSMVRINATEVVGERRSSSWARDQRLFYCIRFSHPMQEDATGHTLAASIAAHYDSRSRFSFGDLKGEPLVVKVGISAVSIEGARKNLEAEVPHWDFDRVRREAEAAWNAKLNKVRVNGGTPEEQRIFHTALYHCYIAPCIFNDVDGHYRGMDGEVHHADHDVYTVFSLWDTFRSLHPLMTLLEPEMTRDWIRTFLLHHRYGGRLPVWELWGNETDCMIGYHSVSVIADAYAKGIRGFDTRLALEAMVAAADADRAGLKAYRERGYIGSEDEGESVSKTLEYAYDDWCIARFAEMTGAMDVARRFRRRSRNWANLYDPDTRFFRARRNGGFVEPFDPYEVNFHHTEANAWHYSLFVPHDLPRFVRLLGGDHQLAVRLDSLFQASPRTSGREQADITGLIGQYAHGNEPSHNYAYLYTRSSRPFATELRVRRIMQELYADAPDGLAGNEDCGQMSAWYVLSALGIFAIAPGDGLWTLGVPLFDEAEIALGEGRTLRIAAREQGGSRTHVERITFNGADPARFRTLDHGTLTQGGELLFLLGPRPGSTPVYHEDEEERDPDGWLPSPIIQAPSRTFADSLRVRVRTIPGPWRTVHTAEHAERTREVPRNAGDDIVLYRSGAVRAHCTDVAGQRGPEVQAVFLRIDGSRTISLGSTFAPQYAAGGEQALLDGLRGGPDFRTGDWQGFQGQDLVATIDLGRPMTVKRVGLGVLQDQRSWIWFPADVQVALSTNQRQWSTATITHDVSQQDEGTIVRDLWSAPLGRKARYITLIARNAGPCPDWHPSAGGASWIFADEVLIEAE